MTIVVNVLLCTIFLLGSSKESRGSIIRPPNSGIEPPSNLSIEVHDGKSAIISWLPHHDGEEVNLRIKALDNVKVKSKTLSINNLMETSYELNNLTPGATYEVKAYTIFPYGESATYTSRNFTTKPNSPAKMVVGSTNETTLIIRWQSPFPAGIFSVYKISIDPPDASVLYVEKHGDPPGPVRVVLKGLVPGRLYNISVYTMSKDEISAPATVQYRTSPLRPGKIAFNPNLITSSSFVVNWEEPNGKSEFDSYDVVLYMKNTWAWHPRRIVKLREEPTFAEFDDLEPGETYKVIVHAISGKVPSWPVRSEEVTLKPLSEDYQYPKTDNKHGSTISWYPHPEKFEGDYWVKWKSRRL